ncbi:MAG: ABC transporter ATP-binding protein [Polyangiaceae bacterium]|nr:ABC transporter ATP-binding protein [Polyangiaceae bacterium]
MRPEAGLFVRARHTLPGGAFTLDVEVDAPRGVTILFGPSGSGKSTLLSVIAGLVTPREGEVRLGNETWLDTKNDVAWPPEHRRVAYVFQSLALFPHMTGLANVAFGIDQSLSKPERERRARDSLSRFRAGHLADRRPKTYSGGEAQRVALARAFAMSPRVVLLDEPFSALDADLRYEFVADVRTASRDLGVPVLHVTHDRAEARVLGDHVIRLDAGKVVASGSPDFALGKQSGPRTSAREELSYDPTEA